MHILPTINEGNGESEDKNSTQKFIKETMKTVSNLHHSKNQLISSSSKDANREFLTSNRVNTIVMVVTTYYGIFLCLISKHFFV